MWSQKIKEWHFNLFVNYYYTYCVLMIEDALKPLSPLTPCREFSFCVSPPSPRFFPLNTLTPKQKPPNKQKNTKPGGGGLSKLRFITQPRIRRGWRPWKARNVLGQHLYELARGPSCPSTLQRVGAQSCTSHLIPRGSGENFTLPQSWCYLCRTLVSD